tara:strand:+ start:492 stop:959 length:468 start_codon:yes stop_codon:yes gene_type:complete
MPIKGMGKVFKALDKVGQESNKKVAGIYADGLKAVVLETPVGVKDGGRARNNWFLSENSPSSKITRLRSPDGSSSLARLAGMPKVVLGRKLFFTNNVPYIETLEYGGYPNPPKKGSWIDGQYQKLSNGGYSLAAPKGMTREALLKMRKAIRAINR